jgi:SagB-type dehydrogenase family enzyme
VLLSWREQVEVRPGGEGELTVQGPAGRVSLHGLLPTVHDALQRLTPPGADEEGLGEQVLAAGGPAALARWYYYREQMFRRSLLCRSVHWEGAPFATLAAVSPSFQSVPGAVPSRPLLSRFAYLRREGSTAVVESPLAHARLVLHDCRSAAVVGALTAPMTAEELSGKVPGLAEEAIQGLLTLLWQAGMIEEAGAEEKRVALQTWEFHDLLFHARSRRGRSDAPFGATYRMAGRLPPPPALSPAEEGERHDLYRPDLDRLGREDPPLARVQEERSSLRSYGERPITDRQLGEILYRVARVRRESEMELPVGEGTMRMEMVSRPYPSGGGLYELEFYVLVNVCANLEAGLYHYDARHHRLIRRCGRTLEVDLLLQDAGMSAGIPPENLQVVVVLSARFGRLAWKYASIAYALVLKHVGVVYHSLYLASTAMGLAPCAVGSGDSDLFARAAGTDYIQESSVGEFLLGSRPETDAATGGQRE